MVHLHTCDGGLVLWLEKELRALAYRVFSETFSMAMLSLTAMRLSAGASRWAFGDFGPANLESRFLEC